MERPTPSGRRYVREGSVPVHDLITREIPKVIDPPPAAAPAVPAEPLDTLLEQPTGRRGTHRRPPSAGTQLAKLAGLGVAAFLLCGSVALGSMIAHKRTSENAASGRPTIEITGEQALLPDRLNETLPPSGAVAPQVRSGSTGAAPGTEESAPRAQTPPAIVDATASSTAILPGSITDTQFVERFYELLPAAPADAFELLSPELLHTDLGDFLQSWSTVAQLEILDLAERADGVLAVVRMQLADGSHLRMQQLLSVADQPRQIVAVELLSAQRN